MTATGGNCAAGIGGGGYADGKDITITDSTVTATGGDCAAGIGGGTAAYEGGGQAENITISGNSQVSAYQGAAQGGIGQGGAIGAGGDIDSSDNPIPGADIDPNTDGLTEGGFVKFFESGATDPYRTIEGTTPAPAPGGSDGDSEGESEPPFQVLDEGAADMEYEQVTEGHVLTIKAPTKYAVLTGKLSALQKLLDEGITEIVFVTKEATSTFSLAELLAKGTGEETFTLTHDGDKIVFLLGDTDISSLLK